MAEPDSTTEPNKVKTCRVRKLPNEFRGNRTKCRPCERQESNKRHAKWRAGLPPEEKQRWDEYKSNWSKTNRPRIRESLNAKKTPERIEASKEYLRRYYAANRERITTRQKAQYWENPEAILAPRRKGPRPRVSAEQKRATATAWEREFRKRNPERANARSRRYHERHPEVRAVSVNRRRARKQSVRHDLTAKQWREILITFNHRCAYCLGSGKLEQEHMIPLSRGGEHTATNVVPACILCNRRKHTKTLLEFLMAA